MTPVRFALIGAGAIARTHADALARAAGCELAAVADPRPGAAAALADPAGCPAFDSAAALLARGPAVDAAVVCTPPDSHEDIVTRLVRAGVPVLCEKPFAPTPAAARRMAAAAARAGVPVTVAAKFRHTPDVAAAKRLLAAGSVGDVVLAEVSFTGRTDMRSRWNSDPRVSGGGVIADNAPHAVDLIRHLFGPLAAVHAVEGPRVWNLTVEDTARVFARTTSGVTADVDLSWGVGKELTWYLSVHGTAGHIQVGWRESRVRYAGGPWQALGAGYDKVAAFAAQAEDFARAVRGGATLTVTADDAVAAVDAVAAAYRSLAAADWHPVAPPAADLARTPPPFAPAETEVARA